MKITLLVSGNIKSNFSYRALQLGLSLRRSGNDVTIIAPSADKYNNFVSEKITSIDGVKILQPFQFKTKRLEINLIPYIIHATYFLLRKRSDLVYIYKPTPISVIGLFSKFFYRTQVILDMDDLGSEVMKIEKHPFYQIKLVAWCEELAAKYANRIVVASTYLHDAYKNKFPSKPIFVMPNGVEASWFDEPCVSEAKKRIVFMGSINRLNILEPLFTVLHEIVTKHPDVEVKIIGDGKYLSYFKELAHSLGLEKNILFTGWLSLAEAKVHLCEGDIGYNYMPDGITNKAASNMKVPQYMARGVVPLVSNVGDLYATIDSGKAGYIAEADSQQSLAGTLLYALNDTERLQKAKQARIFSFENLHWDRLATDFMQWLTAASKKTKHTTQQRIYIVETSIPGNVGGGEIRNLNIIKQLRLHTKAEIEVFCITSKNITIGSEEYGSQLGVVFHYVSNSPRTFLRILKSIFIKRVPPYMEDFASSDLARVFRTRCEEALPDIVHIEQLHSYYCIQQHIPWLQQQGVKIILDCHNVEFKLFQDSMHVFSLPKKLVGKFLTYHLRSLEIQAARQVDVILCCSELDAGFFRTYTIGTHVIPNGVDSSEFKIITKDPEPNIIFMGGIQYPPNEDAMQFFLSKIYPDVKKVLPAIQFLAIGVDTQWLTNQGFTDSSIQGLGFVEDVKPYLEKATIGICPVRYGSGTRIKILTYMAAGLPVVSTHKGAEGVDYTHEQNILLSNSPEDFSESIIKLLTNTKYARVIADQGRNFVREHYDWQVIGKSLGDIYNYEK